jgi:hypothetical protein
MYAQKSCVFGGGGGRPTSSPAMSLACEARSPAWETHASASSAAARTAPLTSAAAARSPSRTSLSPFAPRPPLNHLTFSRNQRGAGQRVRGVHLLHTKLQSFHGRLAHPLRPRRPSPPLRARVAEARAAARRGGASGGGRRRGGASARGGAGARGRQGGASSGSPRAARMRRRMSPPMLSA